MLFNKTGRLCTIDSFSYIYWLIYLVTFHAKKIEDSYHL